MSDRKDAQEIITALNNQNYTAVCPCGCNSQIPLSESGLFYLDDFTPEGNAVYNKYKEDMTEKRRELRKRKQNISKKSITGAESGRLGKILERLAPGLSSIRFKRNDCRALFDPIDYIIFEGLSAKEKVSKIFFVDIKTGTGRLSPGQNKIKNAVNEKNVLFDIYEKDKKS